MNIYFSGAINGGRQKQPTYKALIEHCKELGFVLDEYVGKKNVLLRSRQNFDIYSRNMEWIDQTDIFIAEISVHSFGVGMEIERAISKGCPVLCLYDKTMLNENEISRMITSCKKIKLVGYTTNETAKKIITEFVEKNS